MDQLSITFQALADPTRRAILAQLALGERSVTELAAPFDMSLPGISKHLKARTEGADERRHMARGIPPAVERAFRPARRLPEGNPGQRKEECPPQKVK